VLVINKVEVQIKAIKKITRGNIKSTSPYAQWKNVEETFAICKETLIPAFFESEGLDRLDSIRVLGNCKGMIASATWPLTVKTYQHN